MVNELIGLQLITVIWKPETGNKLMVNCEWKLESGEELTGYS